MTYFTQPNNRSPVPASVYSSWVHPDIENSLVRDYWLSNLDRTICEILADNTTVALCATNKN